jgi:mono/diheme cytochrome c family protein
LAERRARVAVTIACGLVLAAAGSLAANLRLPEGPGVNLVYAKCRTCHDLQYVLDAKGLVPAQWTAVIASMHDYGMTATQEEDAELARYLSTYLGPNPPPVAAAKSAAPAVNASVADGTALYMQNCSTCHGPDGRGQVRTFPPLAGNPDLARDDGAFPVTVVLHGMEGPIRVGDATYDAAMPTFDHLSDAEIAAIVNYVQKTFGNGAATITPSMVAERRAKPMAPKDVHAYRASLGGA